MQGVHDLATISLQSHCRLAQISPRPAISLRSRYDLTATIRNLFGGGSPFGGVGGRVCQISPASATAFSFVGC
jgi:hypothetical protein